ncbi:Predicted ABC-type exoprotein transport system, permease component [Alloiococcus otitis]|uniref:ABC transporter permease n=1 Tax=Alloiococcus otitis ATCC 51267 TaxID=883081 RepID=K9ECR3_9LACT|nr:ABC transporter permease [Alloiococcus otitis]EKU94448.1 hypothetical protein HMPREF9698_00038 [Alloiococcus otitis ATCC 51267]SUU81360.1 Predicted ABC-type exoprotein transport system, permease component [Alloiococcus otitis]
MAVLKDLLDKRRSNFHSQVAKYLRLLFNDQFTILLLFLVGAGGFLYREVLASLHPGLLLGQVLTALILTLLLAWGRIASYTQNADRLFLLPRIEEFKPSLRAYAWQSLLFKVLFLILAIFLFGPLIAGLTSYQVPELAVIGLQVLVLQLDWTYLNLQKKVTARGLYLARLTGALAVLSFVLILANFIFNPFLVSLASLIVAILFYFLVNQVKGPDFILIEQVIREENKRIQTIYRFFNLVTDVPQVQDDGKKRYHLPRLVAFFEGKEGDQASFLLARIFVRQPGYRNLLIRLILVGGLLIVLSSNMAFALIFAGLFILMALYQLTPILDDLNQTAYLKLLPLSQADLATALRKFLTKLAVFVVVIFTLLGLFTSISQALAILVLTSALAWAFIQVYLKRKYE